jgi:hypothetical protein
MAGASKINGQGALQYQMLYSGFVVADLRVGGIHAEGKKLDASMTPDQTGRRDGPLCSEKRAKAHYL